MSLFNNPKEPLRRLLKKVQTKLEVLFLRHGGWNPLPAEPTVNFEIAVNGDHRKRGVRFAQANQAQIGQVGPALFVSHSQLAQSAKMGSEVKRVSNETRFPCLQNDITSPEVISALCKNGLAGKKRLGNQFGDTDSPSMVSIPAIEKSNKESRVGNALHDLENPLRCERFRGPSRLPASSRNGFFSSCCSRRTSIASLTNRPWARPVSLDLRRIHSRESSGSRTVNVVLICKQFETNSFLGNPIFEV